MIESISKYITESIPNDNFYYDLIVKGDAKYGLSSMTKYVLDETDGKECVSEETAWDSICNAMEYYLLDFKGTTLEKQNLWRLLIEWLHQMSGLVKGVSQNELEKILSRPVKIDLELEILKDLHYSKTGITKAELAAKYNVTERTIKEIINKLDVTYKDSEIRIAGQQVAGKINHIDTYETQYGNYTRNRYRYFSLESTINPIFLQMNIAQVHSLLNGLKCSYYQEGRNMSVSTAVEIWEQLSEYTKLRIKKVYCTQDEELSEFVSILEHETYSIGRYHPEKEQIDEDDLSIEEINEIRKKLSY